MRGLRTISILALGILILGGATAWAATSAQWSGTLAAVSGDGLALVGVADRFRLAGGATELFSGKSVRAQDLAPGSSVTLRVGPREADGRFRVDQLIVQPKSPLSLSGEVTRVSDDRRQLEVHGVDVELDDHTAFSGRSGGAISRSARTLRTGLLVRVDLTPGASSLKASAVHIEDSARTPDEEHEAKGTVTAISDAAWTIDGTGFTITADTLFEGDPQVGDFVEVKFHLDGDGNPVADRIEKEDAQDEDVEFVGIVEAIGEASWTISGRVVSVDASTEIDAGIAVGDTVEVRAVEQADGSLRATRIHEEDREDDTPGVDDDHHQGPDDNGHDQGDNNGSNEGGDDHSGSNSGSSSNSGHGGNHHNNDDGND